MLKVLGTCVLRNLAVSAVMKPRDNELEIGKILLIWPTTPEDGLFRESKY
jgi:hypothetical protein